MTLFRSLQIVSFWFLVMIAVVGLASAKYPITPTFPYYDSLIKPHGPRLLTTWAHFDGVHYITIAQNGYESADLIQAFFPLYPLILSFISLFLNNYVLSGVLISLSAFTVSLIYFHKLISLDNSPQIVYKSIWLLLLFPTSFYFAGVYTESLFFMLSILCFYYARKQKWWFAGIFGFFASLTKLIGVFLFLALLWEYCSYRKKYSRASVQPAILAVLGPIVGVLLYSAYLFVVFGDPLLFYSVQSSFGSARDSSRLIFLPQVIYRYIKMFVSVNVRSHAFFVVFQEFSLGIGALIVLILRGFRLRLSYVLFSIPALILPTLTGTLSSMPRYVLPLFPIYVVLAKYLSQRSYYRLILVFVIMLAINICLFTRGIWVS